MPASFINVILLFSEAAHGAAPANGGVWDAFKHFYNEWFNIPGFELWKFINLALFVGILIYLLKKPLTETFKAKREEIRADLIKAEAEKKDAQAKLASVEGRLAQLENEKAQIIAKATAEAENEKQRLADMTASEIARIHSQADAEIARIAGQSRAELRRFAADESVRAAETLVREKIDTAGDAKIVRAAIQQIGGLN